MVLIFNIIYLLAFPVVSLAMISSKELEGYPNGIMSDCPGSTKPAIITPRSLAYIIFAVQGPGSALVAKRKEYNYFQMDKLAKDPNIDFKKKTILFIGGFIGSTRFIIAWIMGRHYKDLGYNVLLLNTDKLTMEYPLASRFRRPIGKHVAEMLVQLKPYGLDPKKLELLGLSLGAQTISYVAKNYRLQTGMNISRLTGLDPAGPCFRNLGPEDRLDLTDADFVEVMQTNIDGFGTAAPVGHVNFYVNGGEYQPGNVIWFPCTTLCSHARSYSLWLSALRNPDSFIGMQCESVQQARDKDCYRNTPMVTNVMGMKTDKKKTGIFYLATSNEPPYYLGVDGLKRDIDFVDTHLRELNKSPLVIF